MNKSTSSVESDQNPEKPFNILIVDDDVEILQLLQDILSFKFPSVKVHAASNGAQAFKLLDTLTSKGINIDYVLTDYVLPILNGAELCKSIKQAHPTVWTAIMTCILLPEDENLLYSNEIQFKPIDFDALFKSVSDQMKNRK